MKGCSNMKYDIGCVRRASFPLWCITACLAAVVLASGCRRDEPAQVPDDSAAYDGPLTIRAGIEGMLETRATHAPGQLRNEDGWVLSCLWKGRLTTDINELENLKASFDSNGYGHFTDRDGNPAEIKWENLDMHDNNYSFALDNGPVGWDKRKDHYPMSTGAGYLNFASLVDDETGKSLMDQVMKQYQAQLEPEGDDIAQNDLIMGCWTATASQALSKTYIDFTLRHCMSRVHVEITAPVFPTLGETKDVKVWITNLAKDVYGFFRNWTPYKVEAMNDPLVSIYPIKYESGGWHLDQSANVFTSNLYLHGKDGNETLLPVMEKAENGTEQVKEGTYRTHYLIMPPQTTHVGEDEDASLRPRLYIKIGEKTYSGVLPNVITSGGMQKRFSEFGSNENITLKVRITKEPPYIIISAEVLEWKDLGTYSLDTNRGGIRSVEDFKAAIKAFNEYVNAGPKWESGKEQPLPLERYGTFADGKFIFHFYEDFPEEDDALFPEECHINHAFTEFFDVNLHGHTVYGCTGKDTGGDGESGLKNKILGVS